LTPQQHGQRRITVYAAVALVAIIEIAVRLGWIGGGGDLRFEIYPWAYINIRGFGFPAFIATARLAEWLAFVGIGVALAIVGWIYYGRLREATGRRFPRTLYGVVAVVAFSAVGWFIVASEPAPLVTVTDSSGAIVQMPLDEARADGLLTVEDEARYSTAPFLFELPTKNNFRYLTGTQISPEYMALLLGLVIYTAAFVAEIVRAGILAVPKGQVEAARALGLSQVDVLQKVILPQALRVIIPPLGNQYLNLAKNSSLAIPIAFADLFAITTTIMNQSGQSVTGMTMAMVTYLIGSLIIAGVMNRVNRRFQLVTR
jgi:ABC-type amino acid transport system permease subunit